MSVNMVIFYSEGRPNDNGLNLSNSAYHLEKYCFSSVDTFTSYTPKKLNDMGYEIKNYSNQFTMNRNPGYAATGFGFWKPLIILLKLNEINYGDIVYYQDINIIKYPQLLNINTYIKEFCNLVLKKRDIFMANHKNKALMKMYCKGDVISRLSEGEPDWYLNKDMFRAAHFICRKTELTVKIVKEWLDECSILDNLTPKTIKKYNFFMWHTAEQAVINMILYKYIKKNILTGFDKKYKTTVDLAKVYKMLIKENNDETDDYCAE
jgi:hypothetical protein